MHLARQLLTMGYLKQEGEYRTLRLTAEGLDMLRKRKQVMGVLQEAERVQKKGRKIEDLEYDQGLFALLRQKRKEMADEAGVPPYVIFSDRTLIEMAAYYPQSAESLLNISGVGQVKSRQYGDFLEVIKTYCNQHGLKEKQKETTRNKSDSNRRYFIVGEAYNSGETIQSLMDRYQVTQGTILGHLTRYLSAGNTLRNGEDLQELTSATLEQQQAAFAAFDNLSPAFLKPVYEKLNGELNYEELKILRMLYLISRQN
jgi:ATP-dependent DNA helicase RecQ